MKIGIPSRPALLLIDIQVGFDDVEYWGIQRNNPHAELKGRDLLRLWRSRGLPVIHVKHYSDNKSSVLFHKHPGNRIKSEVFPSPDEMVIEKRVNSAFIGTDLEQVLRSRSIDTVIIFGFTTDQCVSTTARMAGNLGFNTYVVSDACATFSRTGFDGKEYSAELIHETALASLHQEFATVIDSGELVGLF